MANHSHALSRLAIFLLASAATVFATQPEFKPAVYEKVQCSATSIVTSDFNNDGIPDLAALCDDSNEVAILLGTGGGNYQAPAYYPVGIAGNTSMVAADFNDDGHPDLAVTATVGTSGYLVVFMGSGDGTLQTPVDYPLTTIAWSVAAADFNLDGKIDLAVTTGPSDNKGNVAIFMGNGDGTFQSPKLYFAGLEVVRVTSGDLNGDGAPDLVISHFTSTFGVLLNHGDGTFEPITEYALSRPIASFALGDLNGDGKVDLAATLTPPGSGVIASLGNGDGTFQPPRTLMSGLNFDGLALADFNKDGFADLAVSDTVNTVSVLLGNGDGTFVAPAAYTSRKGLTGASVAAQDLDGDGYPDLVVSGGIIVMLNSGALLPVTLSPTILTFAAQSVGTTSPPQAVKLTDTSSSDLTISNVTVSGDFLVKNKCASTVAPNGSCNLSVQFRPRATGTRKGVITITDSATSSPQKIQLTGTGQ